jgi:hypothetical protein
MRMRLLLPLLLALGAAPAQAQNPTCPTRPPGDSSNACASTAFVQNAIPIVTPSSSITSFGAKCDGTTNDTTAVQTALNSGMAALSVPGGSVCIITAVTLPANTQLFGTGPGATLRRLPSDPSVDDMITIGGVGSQLKDLVFDGNAASETNAGSDVYVLDGSQFTISNVQANNAKLTSGSGGIGFQVQDTGDKTAGTGSQLQNITTTGDQLYGIYLTYTTGTIFNLTINGWNHLGITGGVGSQGLQSNFNPGDLDKIDNLKILNFTINCNAPTGSTNVTGISLPGFIASTGPEGPVYNFGIENVWNAHIAHGTIVNCPSYGLAAQIFNSTITDVHTYNSGFWSFTAGFLLNAFKITFVGNSEDFVGEFGVDAGGCTQCVISNNIITPISVTSPPSNSIGLNIGGNFDTIAADNQIAPAGVASSIAINAEAFEADGNNDGFPWAGAGLVLDHNRIVCATVGPCVGIALEDNMGAQLSGNSIFNSTSPANAYELTSNQVTYGAKNLYNNSNGDSDTVATGSNLIIPDDARTIQTTGTTTVQAILTQSQARVGAGVPYVTLTAAGSGYTSPPTVTITGGTCSTTPTAQAFITGNGIVAGVRMTNTGLCTVAPTGVSFSGGGGGSGAAATPQYELPLLLQGRIISILPGSTFTMTNGAAPYGGVFNRSGSNLTANANNLYMYGNTSGNWTQNQ